MSALASRRGDAAPASVMRRVWPALLLAGLLALSPLATASASASASASGSDAGPPVQADSPAHGADAADAAAKKAAAKAAAKKNAADDAARAQPKSAGAAQVIDVDPARDVAAAWAAFLDQARFDPTYSAYDVLSALGYGTDGVEAKACADQRAALAAAVRAVPVSIAIRRAEMLCAEAAGDEAGAERALAALAALSKHALTEYGDGAMRRPIRVVQPWDIYALLHSLGYEFLYEYPTQLRAQRYFPITVAAWDAQREVEWHLSFDYIDTTARIDHDSIHAGWPVLRDENVLAYARGQAKNEDTVGIDVLGVADAIDAAGGGERIAALRKAAERGGLQSLAIWLTLCTATDAPKGCSDGLIDVLLPLAERRQALPMALLSHAYRYGLGVERDVTAADSLLKAADKRWQRSGAAVYLVGLMLQESLSDQALAYLPQLRRAAAGNPDARFLQLLLQLGADKGTWEADDIAFLQSPANNGLGAGHAALGRHHRLRGDQKAALRSFIAAAQAGDPHGQGVYGAAMWIGREGVPRDAVNGERLLRQSAHGGDLGGMRMMAYVEMERRAWRDAVRWLEPAVQRGDADAALLLANLYATSLPDLGGGAEDAVRIYGLLDRHYDMAEARRRLALLAMDGRGMGKDPDKARQLLQRDAEAGDVGAQTTLGMAILSGRLGAVDVQDGTRWMQRAIKTGDVDARTAYGSWLTGRDTATERSRGIAMLESVLPDAQSASARNNLAWARCVSPHADVRDPAKGLQLARPMEDDPDTGGGDMDTVAACYAAAGDFDKAVALQRRAMELADVDETDQDSSMPGRLKLYLAGKAFIDTD